MRPSVYAAVLLKYVQDFANLAPGIWAIEAGCSLLQLPLTCCLTACRREVDEREKDPAFVSDAYAECYPGYHEYNQQVVDSDDEADYTHMDSKLGKSRTEFNTEEEWQV